MSDIRETISTAIRNELPDSAFSQRTAADAVLSALSAAGYRIVPAEPTEKMVEAAKTRMTDTAYLLSSDSWKAKNIYATMLAAAKEG